MAKVLLVNPQMGFYGWGSGLKPVVMDDVLPRHGLTYLAAALQKSGHQVGLADLRLLGGWEEYKAILKDIARFKEILANERLVLTLIREELTELEKEFGDPRRTEIITETKEITIEDMIVEEDMVVTISKGGYIKRNPITLYQSQHRGGKGKTAMGTKAEDFVEHLFVASTHHTFLFFTNQGKVYW